MVEDVQEVITIVKGLKDHLNIPVTSTPEVKKLPFVEFSGVNIDSIQSETKDQTAYLLAFTLTIVSGYHGIAELTTVGASLIDYFKDTPLSLQSSTISTQLTNGKRYNAETYIFTVKSQ